MTYNGTNIADIIADSGHPALQPEPGDADVETNDLYQQLNAALAWGAEYYWSVPRERRAMLTGHHIARTTLQAMLQYDDRKKAEREAEIKSRRKNR